MPNLAVFKMPVPMKITGRSSTITNAFVNSIIPVVPPTDSDVETALSILGMAHSSIECAYCGGVYSEWDHLRPLVKDKMPTGYISEIQNLVPSCGKCNQSKGNKDWQNWIVSDAKKSPRTRRITDIDARMHRLNSYMNWLKPTFIDFEAVVGTELWKEHWSNCKKIQDHLIESQKVSEKIKQCLNSSADNSTVTDHWTISGEPNESMLEIKIGELVRSYIPEILEQIKVNKNNLLIKLQDKEYSKRVFDIQFPFLIKTSINSPRENRYWAQLYDVDGTNYRVTSEWFENKSRDKFLMFLKNQDIGCLS